MKRTDPITRRKQRWKIADLMQSGFTDTKEVFILSLSCHSKAGILTPINTGDRTPLLGVFLCPVISTALFRMLSVMAGLFGQLSSWPEPVSGSENPLNPVAQRFSLVCGGYPINTGIPQ